MNKKIKPALLVGSVTLIAIGTTSIANAFTLNGDAIQLSPTTVRLTSEQPYQRGSAFSPITLGEDGAFHTSFSFKISSGNVSQCYNGFSDEDGPGADGLVFVTQNESLHAFGGRGGDLGYNSLGAHSVGIEFDTYNNGPVYNDPDGNHVGIDTSGLMQSIATAPVSGRFNDNVTRYAWIDYDGTTLEVRVSTTNSRPSTATLSHAVNISSILNGTSGWIGFTSGTGAGCGNHDILSYSTTVPISIDIKPGSYPNSINLSSNGVVPVAILGSSALNVNNIDPASCHLAEASVKMVGKADNLLCSTSDVNKDSIPDLTCQFVTANLGINDTTTSQASVACNLIDGTTIMGTDSINIVPQ